MVEMIKRKEYMRSTYAKYWIGARDNIYGFMPYDKALIELIRIKCPVEDYRNILEVAIGTGIPIAKTLAGSGGAVIFDLLNIHNSEINNIYRKHVFENTKLVGMIYKVFKNTLKFLVRRGVQNWPFVVSQTPSDPRTVVQQLLINKVKDIQIFGRESDSLTLLNDETYTFSEYDRLVLYGVK